MKKTFTLIAFIAFSTGSFAQIVLNQSSYTSPAFRGTDSTRTVSNLSVLAGLPTGSNRVWDLSTLQYTNYNETYFSAPNSIVFTAAHYADSTFYTIGNYAYQVKKIYAIDAGSWQVLGEQVKEVAYDLGGVTVNTDTIRLPAQENAYSIHRPLIQFPATANSSWSSDITYSTQLYIKAPSMGLPNSIGMIRTRIESQDTVTGWGTMRVADKNLQPTGFMQVLQVQNKTIYTDSFFVDGSPANPFFLAALSLTQGQSRIEYSRAYYRSNEVTPLAKVYFSTAAYTMPTDGEVHMQRLSYLSVANIDNNDNISVYPNPVTDRSIVIEFKETQTGQWSADLLDITGRLVQSGNLQVGNTAAMAVSDNIPTGVYYMLLKNNGEVVGRKTLAIR